MAFIQDFLNTRLSAEIGRSPIHSCISDRDNEKLHKILQLQLNTIVQLKKEFPTLNFPMTIELPHQFKVIKSRQNPILFDLDQSVSHYGLTPLHIAIITRNLEAVKLLCQAGADINKADEQGWTPLHHAAMLCDLKFYQFLQEQKADESLRNKLGGTPANLRQMVTAIDIPSNDVAVPFIIDKKQTLLNGNVFKYLTNATFIKKMYVSADLLYKKWTDLTIKIEPYPFLMKATMPEVWKKDYLRHIETPYKLTLQEAKDPASQKSTGLGVFAGTKIPKGKIICEYLGKLMENSAAEKNVDYLLCNIQSLEHRDFGAMINDGFPTAVMIELSDTEGLEHRSVLIALEEIKPGAQIFWDYGTSSLKANGHRELNMEAARHFFRSHSIKEIVNKTRQVINRLFTSDYPHLDDFIRALYLMHTPTTAIRLYLEEIISNEDLQLLAHEYYSKDSTFTLNVNPYFTSFVNFYESQNQTFKEVFKAVIQKYFEQGKQQTIYNIFRNISHLDNFVNHPMEDLMFVCQLFCERIDENTEAFLKEHNLIS